jgi:hypothetical protein
MDDFRHDVRAALEAEWGRQPAPDLGARAVDHAISHGRRHRSQRLSRVVAVAVAVVLALAAAGTLTYLGRFAHRPSVPAGTPAPTPAATPTPAQPSPTPSPAPSPSSTPAGPPAFAVLSQPVQLGQGGQAGQATVSIADPTGRVLASAKFDPPQHPMLGNVADVLQPPVRVAAGAVFYADGHGVVRRLGRDGSVTTVATFPATGSQQELSFAVSLDGRQLMASVLTTPPLHVPPPANVGDPVFADNGHWSLELFTADAGQPAVSTFKRDLGTQFPRPTVIAGWDAGGPLATLDTQLGTQQATASLRFAGDSLVHVGPDGTHLDQVAGGCRPLDEVADGTVLCLAGAPTWQYEIRRSSGELVWQHAVPGQLPAYTYLSPDGAHVAVDNLVFGRDGRTVTLGPAPTPTQGIPRGGLRAQGWLDDHTVVGALVQADGSAGKVGVVDLGSPGQVRQLPLDGQFVAML